MRFIFSGVIFWCWKSFAWLVDRCYCAAVVDTSSLASLADWKSLGLCCCIFRL